MYGDTDTSSSEDARDDYASHRSDVSDTSSDVTELEQADFPAYFIERGGRLFHSHGNSPYPLPVDADEQQRVNGQHDLLYQLLGRHYRGPVRRVLRGRRRVLDLCTGTGRWVLDMAHDFPNVRFDGIDIVPIATRHPPDNVHFEMANVNEPLRYSNGAFDFVHARSISMAVYNYPALLDQVARVLRPGGLFLACEWGRTIAMANGGDPRMLAPRSCAFFGAISQTLSQRRIYPIAGNVQQWLVASNMFNHVRPHRYEMPVGHWPTDPRQSALGIAFRECLETYAESMRIMMLEAGCRREEVDHLVDGFRVELDTVQGMVCPYYTVHALRVRN